MNVQQAGVRLDNRPAGGTPALTDTPAVPLADGLGGAPRVAVLTGAKRGDNAQLRMLAQHLGLPYRELQLSFNPLHILPNALLPDSTLNLRGATRRALDDLGAVDVVLSIGKRSYRAARALKRRSGGGARWIHLGRPWGPLDAIDLLITTPQYGMAAQPKVLVLPTPLPTVTLDSSSVAKRAGERPLCAVLLGGDSTSHHMNCSDYTALLAAARREAARHDARLLLVDSRRTPRKVRAAVKATRGEDIVPQPEDGTALDYTQVLSRADAFIVTSDSASMLGEALMTGKPVYVFRSRERLAARVLRKLDACFDSLSARCGVPQLREECVKRGWWVPPRDIDALLASLGNFQLRELGETPPRDWHAPAAMSCLALQMAVSAARKIIGELASGEHGDDGERPLPGGSRPERASSAARPRALRAAMGFSALPWLAGNRAPRDHGPGSPVATAGSNPQSPQ
jgi:hypothetical protein